MVKIKDAQQVTSPKGTDKLPVSDGSDMPRSITLEQIKDFIGGGEMEGGGLLPPMTIEEYNALEEKMPTLYFITDEQGVVRIYYGLTLIARRKAEGEATNLGFPLVLPIVFG